jgi:hypothetical protein
MKEYKVQFTNNFGVGNVVSNDIEYGNHYLVKSIENNTHVLQPLHEGAHSPNDFKGGIAFFKVYQMVMEGEGTKWSDVQFNPPKRLKHYVV